MLIVVQERNTIINSKDFVHVYFDKYYYKEDDDCMWSDYYVQENLDEFPDIKEYKTAWIIRTNNGWEELGRYSSKETAKYAMDKLLNNKFLIFFMSKDKGYKI